MATCPNKNDGVKMAQRFVLVIFSINPFVCDVAMWCQSAPSGTTLPHHKQMDLLKKVSNMDLLFFSVKNSLNINIRENAHPEFLDPRNIQPVIFLTDYSFNNKSVHFEEKISWKFVNILRTI